MRARRCYSQLVSNLKSSLPLFPILKPGYRYPIFKSRTIASLLDVPLSTCTENFVNFVPSSLLSSIDNTLIYDYIDYLPYNINVKSDEVSMYYGVESRSPFQDPFLRQLVFSLPLSLKYSFGSSKSLLRQLHKQKYNNYSERAKSGFVANYSSILQNNDLQDLYRFFVSSSSNISSYLNTDHINSSLSEDYSAQRWNFMVLSSWLEYNF